MNARLHGCFSLRTMPEAECRQRQKAGRRKSWSSSWSSSAQRSMLDEQREVGATKAPPRHQDIEKKGTLTSRVFEKKRNAINPCR